jgi:hypothetical protein
MLRIKAFGFALLCALSVPAAAQQAQVRSSTPTFDANTNAPLQADTSGNLKVVVNGNTATGTSAAQVQGNVASAATDSGNPVKVACVYNGTQPTFTTGQRGDVQCSSRGRTLSGTGGQYSAQDALPNSGLFGWAADDDAATAARVGVTANMVFNGSTWDRTRGDANGLVVQPALSATFWGYAAASGGIVSSTADVAVKAAGGASVRNYVCSIDISHAALSAASEIVIKDGATVIWRAILQTPATDIGGGAGKLPITPCLRGTANTAVNVALITSVTGGVYVNLTGYTGS